MSKTTGRKADPANRTRLKAKAKFLRKTGPSSQLSAVSRQPARLSATGRHLLTSGSPTTPTAGGGGGGGGERDRTDDLLLAKQALSQLSYTPNRDQGSEVRDQTEIELIPDTCHLMPDNGGPG